MVLLAAHHAAVQPLCVPVLAARNLQLRHHRCCVHLHVAYHLLGLSSARTQTHMSEFKAPA